MGYCVYTDVQADFKNITFGSIDDVTPTMVTQEAVTQFITEASALIDSYVGSRYVTPITGTKSLALMSLFCRTLVADRVRGILANKQQTNTDANQQVKSSGFGVRDVMKSLQDIKDGVSTLTDATLAISGSAFYSQNNQSGINPRFQKNRRQW